MKTKLTLLLWTLILCACSGGVSTPQTLPTRTPSETPLPQPVPKIVLTVSTPHIDQGPDGNMPGTTAEVPPSSTDCSYQWAYQDLPELTALFEPAVKRFIPDSTSHVTAYGENCVNADGQIVRFLPMETDFYVLVPVNSLDDHETFGNWIAQVMNTVNQFPPDMVAGPNPGFVEFRFEKNMTESIGFRVSIREYNETANGLTGEELFQLFYKE